MATKAQRADIIQVALATAFRYRQNVIGIPQTLAYPFVETPVTHECEASGTACALQPGLLPDGVKATVSANAPVSFEYLLAQVAWLQPQLPLVDATV